MKILAVADYPVLLRDGHIQTEDIGEVDLILSCGDLAREYLSALSRSFHAPLYFVKGNHDIRTDSVPPDNCVDIHLNTVSFGAINILGIEGSRWYNGGPHQYTERQMKQMVRFMKTGLRKRGDIDIVVTHAAPRHIHDSEDRCHQGFKIFRRLIDRYKPRYFLHGHIHEHFTDPVERITLTDSTKVVNCCGYFYLDLDNEKISG